MYKILVKTVGRYKNVAKPDTSNASNAEVNLYV